MPIDLHHRWSEKMAGQGWRMLVECLSVGRGITLPSNSPVVCRWRWGLHGPAYPPSVQNLIGKMEGIEEPLARYRR